MEVFKDVRIATPRLVLRAFRHDDKDTFYSLIQDPQIYRTMPEDHMYNREEVGEIVDYFIHCYGVNRVNNVPKFSLAIVLRECGEMIGDVGIGHYSKDPQRTEIFYFLNSRYWNRGFASEAARAFLNYVRRNWIVEKLIGTVVPGNEASARILEKNGFRRIEHSYDDEREFYELQIHGNDCDWP